MTVTTTTKEIPREEWTTFLDDFSRRHEGWLVTMEVMGTDIGAQIEGNGLPLDGISADLKDRECFISVALGGTPDRHITHTIGQPTALRLEATQTESGVSEALQIEAPGSPTTLLRFSPRR